MKLLRPWISPDDAQVEQHKASIVSAMGVPVPAVGGIVHYEGRIGLIYERIEGSSMMDRLSFQLDVVRHSASLLADLHIDLHAHAAPEALPAQSAILKGRITQCHLLSSAERKRLLAILDQIACDEKVCHGDFHPGNVILTPRGPVIIDWIDASRGCPMADVARTSLLFRGHIDGTADSAAKAAMELYHRTYMEHYREKAQGNWRDYERWSPIMAAARLREGITEQQEWLLQQVHTGLEA